MDEVRKNLIISNYTFLIPACQKKVFNSVSFIISGDGRSESPGHKCVEKNDEKHTSSTPVIRIRNLNTNDIIIYFNVYGLNQQ